jgi:hypothetical protein
VRGRRRPAHAQSSTCFLPMLGSGGVVDEVEVRDLVAAEFEGEEVHHVERDEGSVPDGPVVLEIRRCVMTFLADAPASRSDLVMPILRCCPVAD